MARDGNIDVTLEQARSLALRTITALDTRHGDPSRNSNWINERRLAQILYALVHRLDASSAVIEVPR